MDLLPKNLFSRISLLFLLLVMFFALGQFYMLFYLWQRAVYEQEQRLNWSLADHVALELGEITRADLDTGKWHERLAQIQELNPRIEIFLLAENGRLIADVEHLERYWLEKSSHPRWPQIDTRPLEEFLAVKPNRDLPVFGPRPNFHGSKVRYPFSVARIQIEGKPGYLYVILQGQNFTGLAKGIENYYVIFGGIVSSAVMILLTFLLGRVLFGRVTRRMTNIIETVSKFASGNLDSRVSLAGADEITRLGSEINQMADTIVGNIGELKEMDRTRRQLVANISHDIGGPLSILIGQLEKVSSADKLAPVEELQSRLVGISRNAWALRKLIDELFELSKLEGREKLPHWEAFSLLDIVTEEILPKYASQAAEEGLNLRAEHPEKLPRASGDSAMIERVLSNLVENALRYSDKSGEIVVALREIPNRSLLEVTVSDQGPGIALEDQALVFERFYRGQSTAHKKGTGLGLAIVKQIVEVHNQEIRVESVPGQGARFVFTVACAKSQPAERDK